MGHEIFGQGTLRVFFAALLLETERGDPMAGDFKRRHFRGGIILWAVRRHCRNGISCRDLEEMLEERGVKVDHTTICRWVQQASAPEIEKHLRRHCRLRSFSRSWRVDETCIKVKGKWSCLYRAVDSHGNTIDFHLSQTRSAKAAKRFLGKALCGCKSGVDGLKNARDSVWFAAFFPCCPGPVVSVLLHQSPAAAGPG